MMRTDFHCHLLPGMDDGAGSAAESAAMLRMLREQGVGQVAATPHYSGQRESPDSFLARRDRAARLLEETLSTKNDSNTDPKDNSADQKDNRAQEKDNNAGAKDPGAQETSCASISGIMPVLGAEVLLYRGISEKAFLPSLTMGESRRILLEPPHGPFREWLPDEIFAVGMNWGLIPVVAHVERYLGWYKAGEMERLLSVEGAVFQINNSAVSCRSTKKFALGLIRSGFPVVFGSDAHGAHVRAPDFDAADAVLRRQLSRGEYEKLIQRGIAD